jgi:hypothetical protein
VDFDHERIDKQYFKEALRKTISDEPVAERFGVPQPLRSVDFHGYYFSARLPHRKPVYSDLNHPWVD